MTKWAFRSVVLVAGLVAAILLVLPREPYYQGRSLTSWLQQCYDVTPLMETQRLAEAQAAVRAMPVNRVLPRLLRLAEARDNPIIRWVLGKSAKLPVRFPKRPSAGDLQQLGIAGFEALGTNATPTISQLTRLLEDKGHAFTALRCLLPLGKSSEMALCHALTNQDSRVREGSIYALASVTDDAEVYVDRLTNSLNDPDSSVRAAAVDGIGAQTLLPDRVIPILITELKEPDGMVSLQAAESLAVFGTNAMRAFPALSDVVENGSIPNTTHQALRTLVTIAPGEALSIVLKSLQSSNSSLRRVSLGLLGNYPVKSPDIQSLIERTATDPDPALARMAKLFITEQYSKEHPDESLFPDEPVYGGKRLGEWLKMHDPQGGFAKDAEDAIRHMGTNSIPALLERLVFERPPFGLPAYEVNIDAMRGFIVMREQTKPALPQLLALMDSTNRHFALFAMLAACGTGSNAMPLLMKGLTNPFADVRSEAAHYLTEGIGAQFPEQRKQAVPFLTKLLDDPDEHVRMNATNDLKEIDPRAASKAAVK